MNRSISCIRIWYAMRPYTWLAGKGSQRLSDGSIRSLELLIAEGSLGEREAKAYASEMYKQAMEAYENATAETETLRAQREAAVYTIETCRSQNSARKQGVSL